MSSLYAHYLMERTDDFIIENDDGFASYRFMDDGKRKYVYIVDIFVLPNARRIGAATWMADEIVKDAKERGYSLMIGSVVPSAKNSTASLRVLLGYGMSLDSASNDFIVFRKEI